MRYESRMLRLGKEHPAPIVKFACMEEAKSTCRSRLYKELAVGARDFKIVKENAFWISGRDPGDDEFVIAI